jgi:outer membrane protein assembly factor BamB
MRMKNVSDLKPAATFCIACCSLMLWNSVLAGDAAGREVSWAARPDRNMVQEAKDVPTELTDQNLLWTVDSGTSHQYPMPAIIGDKVLIGGNVRGNPDPYWARAITRGGSLVCRRLSDGQQIWRLVSPDEHRQGGFGICGSPVVEGDRVYVQSVHQVYCLDLEGMANGNQGTQGELELMMQSSYRRPEGLEPPTSIPDWAADVIWQFSFSDMGVQVQDAISCTPLVANGQIWVATANEMGALARGHKDRETGEWVPRPPAPHLLVLDKETGELIAKDNMDVPIVWHGEWSSPSAVTVDGETIVIFGDGYGMLHGFALPRAGEDGEPVVLEELWTFDLNPPEYRYDDQGREHPYALDTRLLYKYPLDWIKDEEKWFTPPEEWAEYRADDDYVKSYKDMPLDRVKFRSRRAPELAGPTKANGPAELIAMPVVVGNLVYLGIGRDYAYSMGDRPAEREYLDERNTPRKFGLGRFMCLEFDDVKKPPRIRWEDRDIAHTQSNASVYKGLVYVSDLGGFLNCWDAGTGEVMYKADVGASVRERSQLVADDKVYVCNDARAMHVFKAMPEPVRLPVSRLPNMCSTPSAHDGVLVFATARRVFAYGTHTVAEVSSKE